MNTILYATFDGEVLRPDLPVRLPPNTRVRGIIETPEEDSNAVSFLDTAEGCAGSQAPLGNPARQALLA